jgi:ATP-dependent Clp protease ATP-binding subunit ClpC
MFFKVSERAQRAIARATEIADVYRFPAVGPSHVLHGILSVEGVGVVALRGLQVDQGRLRRELELAWGESAAAESDGPPDPPKEVLARASFESARLGMNYIGTEHLLLAVVRQPDEVLQRVLTSLNIRADAVIEELEVIFEFALKRDPDERDTKQLMQRLDGLAVLMKMMAAEIESIRNDLEDENRHPGNPET